MGGLLALLAALGFSVRAIFIRKGLMEENPGNAWEINLVILVMSLVVFVIGCGIALLFGFNILYEFQYLTSASVWLFIMEGALGPLTGGLLLTLAVAQIGATHASSIRGGANPLFVTIFAIAFLGERPELLGLIAIVMIVTGVLIIGFRDHLGTIVLMAETKIAGGFLAILSGLCYGLSQTCRGAAIKYGATANTGFVIGTVTAIAFTLIVCLLKSRDIKLLQNISKKSFLYYLLAGICTLIGSYTFLMAFTLLPVWQAAAIRNIQPLLVFFLTCVFLKDSDKVNMRLAMGTFLVTIGVVIINII